MPLIRSIEALADGFRITPSRGAAIVFTSNDLSAAQKLKTPQQLEADAITFLTARLNPNDVPWVHLTSVVPLLGRIAVCTGNEAPPSNWWLI